MKKLESFVVFVIVVGFFIRWSDLPNRLEIATSNHTSYEKATYEFWKNDILKKYPNAHDFCSIDEVEFEEMDENNYIYGIMKFKGTNLMDETKTFKVRCVARINSEGKVASNYSFIIDQPLEESFFDKLALKEKEREKERENNSYTNTNDSYENKYYEDTENTFSPNDIGINENTDIDINLLNSYFESINKDYSNYTYTLLSANEDGTISYQIRDKDGYMVDNLDIDRSNLSLYRDTDGLEKTLVYSSK